MIFSSVDQFLQELSLLNDEIFPESRLETVYSRLDKVSLRLVMSAALFVDIYFNAENGRLDFTLIHNNKRVFGYDNLKNWHRHTHENPEKHIECDQPTLRQIVQETALVVASLKK